MKKSVLMLFAISFVFVFSSNFYASTNSESSLVKCKMMDFKTAFKYVKGVFIGEILSVEKDGNEKTFKIKVKKSWKGVKTKEVMLTTYESFRYQAPFKVGESYLIFARGIGENNEKYGDGRCSRTRNVKSFAPNLKEDLKKLKKKKPIFEAKDEDEKEKPKVKEIPKCSHKIDLKPIKKKSSNTSKS